MHSFEKDNELDDVAKRAAEAFDAPGMTNWDKMQLLLEKEMPLDKPKKRFFWILIPALLLLVIGGAWWYSNHDQQLKVKETSQKPNPVQTLTLIEQPTTIEQNITPEETSTFNKIFLNRSKIFTKIQALQVY